MPLLLEAFPAEHRTPLRRTKRHRRILAALRALCAGFRFHVGVTVLRRRTQHCHPFALTVLAAFGFVLELLIVEEQLFAGGKDKICTAIDTLQNLVLEFHWRGAPVLASLSNSGDLNGEIPARKVVRGFTIPLIHLPLDSARHAKLLRMVLLFPLSRDSIGRAKALWLDQAAILWTAARVNS
jgi:hypothetical protein